MSTKDAILLGLIILALLFALGLWLWGAHKLAKRDQQRDVFNPYPQSPTDEARESLEALYRERVS